MRLGLCLSGGGVRGVAHLGVLKAFDEAGISIDIISGVSSGAIAGVFYAVGFSPDETLQLIKELSLTRFLRPAFNRGILRSEALHKIFEEYLGGKTFEDLSIPVIVSSLDLVEGTTVYFSQGFLSDALAASCSVPVLFKPSNPNKKLLVDGGLVNNLPVECLTGACDKIVGVHVNPIHHQADLKSIRQITERVFHLALNENVRHRVPLCHFYLEPPQLQNYHVYAIDKIQEIYTIGYEYTLELIHDLKIKIAR